MKEYFTIYYPTRDKDGAPIEDNHVHFARILAQNHGGCTVQAVEGIDGVTGVHETIHQCKVFADKVDPDCVRDYAKELRDSLNQNAVAFEINGEMFFTE